MLIFDSYAIIFQHHMQTKVLMQSTSFTPPEIYCINVTRGGGPLKHSNYKLSTPEKRTNYSTHVFIARKLK